MATARAWSKGTEVRHGDRRGKVARDAEPGASVRVAWASGGSSGWVAGRLLVEVDDQGRDVKP